MARQTFTSALRAALKGVATQPADQAAVLIAQRYAAELDNGGDLTKVGPQLLRVLAELAMTPLSRATVLARGGDATPGKGGNPSGPASPVSELDRIRQRRAARQHRTSAVDATAS